MADKISATSNHVRVIERSLYCSRDLERQRTCAGLTLPAADVVRPLLPYSIDAALGALEADGVAALWWSCDSVSAYLAFKRAEFKALEMVTPEEICARYAAVH